MKRFCILLLAISLLFCSCAGKQKLRSDRIPEWPFRMTASLEMQTPDTVFAADWTYKNSQSTFTLRSPQEMSGVTMVCNAVESRVESGGVEVDLPQQSAFVLLDRAYRALTDGMVEPQRTGEGWLYDGMDRYGFEALGAEDGSLHIRFPKVSAEAVFTAEEIETENAS